MRKETRPKRTNRLRASKKLTLSSTSTRTIYVDPEGAWIRERNQEEPSTEEPI